MKRQFSKSFLLVVFSLFMATGTQALEMAKDFNLTDYNNHKHSLSDYQDSKATVVMFVSTQCPVSNAYNSRMVALYNDYHSKGVTFLAVNSNVHEDVETIKKHATEQGFKFSVLKDYNNVVADEFGASATPEVYVLDNSRNVLYHGRIDDSRRETEVQSHDLRTALDQVLAGKVVTNTQTKAFGCSIKRVSK